MNKKIIKHIIATDFSWKKKQLLTAILTCSFILIAFLLVGGIGDAKGYKFFIYLLYYLAAISIVFSTPSISRSTKVADPMRLTGTSWKYLSSIISDRKSYIVSQIYTALINLVIGIPFLLAMMYLQGLEMKPATYAIGFLVLFVIFVRLSVILGKITEASRNYTHSRIRNAKKISSYTKINVFSTLGLMYLGLLHFSALDDRSLVVILPIIALVLIFSIFYIYKRIIKVWSNEKNAVPTEKSLQIRLVLSFVALFILAQYTHQTRGSFTFNIEDLESLVKDSRYNKIIRYKNVTKEVNTYSKRGRTPLIEVIIEGKKRIVEFFLDNGADINMPSKKTIYKSWPFSNKITPLMVAIAHDRTDIAKLLIERGADISYKNPEGINAFHIAARVCDLELMDLLVSKGQNPSEVDNNGQNAYFHACKAAGCLSVIDYLKSLGVDSRVKDKSGKTYLEFMEMVNPKRFFEYNFKSRNFKKGE